MLVNMQLVAVRRCTAPATCSASGLAHTQTSVCAGALAGARAVTAFGAQPQRCIRLQRCPAAVPLFAGSLRAGSGCGRQSLQVCAAIKKDSGKNVVCCKELVAREDTVDEVVRLCQGLVDYSKASMADRSSGILAFECSRDPFEPLKFYTWERYSGNAALGQHNSADAVQRFMEEVNEHLEKPVGMVLYEWQDGQLGAACMQGGPKGEGGLDDASGASGGAGGASMKQTSATVNLGKVRRGDEGDAWGMKPPAWAKDLPWFGKKNEDAK